MVVQSNNLNLIPGQISPRVNVSQYDKKSRTLTFSLYNGSQPFNITSGMAVTIEGTKPDNTGFQYAMTTTIDSNVVSISIEQQMTVIAGDVPCEIVVSNAGKRLASANFILVVEPAALKETTIISETELPLIEEAAELAENIAIYVTTIHEDALKAEGYAVGKQNGVDVGSGSEYFHNNAKYHKEQAEISATNASNSANTASTAASTATTKASEATSAASTATSKASEATTAAQTATTKASEASASAQTAQEAAESLIGEVVDSEPYVLRQGKGNLADMSLVGGSLAWNQLVNMPTFTSTNNGITSTASATTHSVRITSDGANTQVDGVRIVNQQNNFVESTIAGHKVLFDIGGNNPNASKISQKLYASNQSSWGGSNQALISNDTTFKPFIVSVDADKSYYNWYLSIKENTTCDFTLKPQINDLTQMFGSTIADYIYSLEQATAGAGVAWFRQYFRNLYYGYDAGSIQSVNPSYRKVVGKNQLKLTATALKTYNPGFTWNGNVATYGNVTVKLVVDKSDYVTDILITSANATVDLNFRVTSTGNLGVNGMILSVDNQNVMACVYDESGEAVVRTDSVTVPSNYNNYRLTIFIPKNSTFNEISVHPMLRFADTSATYEPYHESTYAFDPSVQLRGVPKLVDNKLSYDGDIYRADGSATRKYGIVDLGTLDWKYNSTNNFFWLDPDVLPIKQLGNLLCARYVYVGAKSDAEMASVDNMSIALSAGKNIKIKDTSYSDAATFKTAMSGVYLVFEKATPTTFTATPYQNPQRAFIDGTEEFIDAGVTASTRDVSIPVGNNTTYYKSELLPPIEDYADGAVKGTESTYALGETGCTFLVKKRGNVVSIYRDNVTTIESGASVTVGTLPEDWRPPKTAAIYASEGNDGNTASITVNGSTGAVTVKTSTSNYIMPVVLTYLI